MPFPTGLRPLPARAGADDCPAAPTLHGNFARLAAAHPTRTAIASDLQPATYRELDAAGNRLAHAVIGRGGRPGDRVAILMGHDAPLIGAALGVLKAGRNAVVLAAGDPPARLRELMADAGTALVVTDSANKILAGDICGSAAVLDFGTASGAGPAHDPGVSVGADDMAFLIYKGYGLTYTLGWSFWIRIVGQMVSTPRS